MRKWKAVQDFDSDSQSADEAYDPAKKIQTTDGVFATGRGQQGGSSKPTPQAQRMTTGNARGGSYKIGNSAPKQTQKIRP